MLDIKCFNIHTNHIKNICVILLFRIRGSSLFRQVFLCSLSHVGCLNTPVTIKKKKKPATNLPMSECCCYFERSQSQKPLIWEMETSQHLLAWSRTCPPRRKKELTRFYSCFSNQLSFLEWFPAAELEFVGSHEKISVWLIYLWGEPLERHRSFIKPTYTYITRGPITRRNAGVHTSTG